MAHMILADRNGEPIEQAEWMGLTLTPDYCTVRHDKINGIDISTVWTGIGSDRTVKPLIFESMTFVDLDYPDQSWSQRSYRYATEEEAVAGHERMCEKARRTPVIIREEEEWHETTL